MIDYFSHIPILHLATFVGDVTVVNNARCTNELETANKQHIKQ